MSPAALKPHCFQNCSNAIPDCGGRSQRKVKNPEFDSKSPRNFPAYHFAHAGYFESRLFDGFRNFCKIGIFKFRDCSIHNPRSADPNIDNALRFTNSMKGSCHKRIIFRGICKNHKLGASYPIPISSQICSLFYYAAHQANCIHINSSFCGGNIYR